MICESCSVCGTSFDVVFRYQMEERNGGFAFYCSQKCLETSQTGGADGGVTCDACSKRFSPDLVSQVLYVAGKRKYACGLECRAQLVRESQGARLGDLADQAKRQARDVRQSVPSDVRQSVPSDVRQSVPSDVRQAPTSEVRQTVAADALQAPTSEVRQTAVSDVRQSLSTEARVEPSAPVVAEAKVAPPLTMPLSTPPPPASQKPPASRAQPRGRREEGGPAISARASGLMAAIRPESEDAAPRGEPPGTVIPILPSMKGAPRAPEPRTTAPRRIAVFNHKGGTGKTTTAVSVAAGLAAKGKRVLLVDTDAQGNVSVSLGAGSERSLYHVLVMGLRVADAVKQVRPNLDLLPSNETLAAAELYLAGRQNRDRVLADRLTAASADYDYVVLDCSPSLSLMNQNALVFADSVLIPVACDYLSLVGVRQVLKTVKNVNALLHHPVQIWGVLPTFFDGRAKICNEAVATLKDHFGDKCLPPIRAAIKVKEAPSVGQTIFEYAAGSNAAEDYGVVVDRIVGDAKAAPAGETAREQAQATA